MPTLRFTAHFPIQKRKSSFSPVVLASEYYHVASGDLHVAVDIPADEIYAIAQAEPGSTFARESAGFSLI